ncbi:hypothetical protein CCP3SC15_1960001 [Gammaproteobacteria bacterium]
MPNLYDEIKEIAEEWMHQGDGDDMADTVDLLLYRHGEYLLKILSRHEKPEPSGDIMKVAKRLYDCLRNLTDGTGDGYQPRIDDGRRAVIDNAWLDHLPSAPKKVESSDKYFLDQTDLGLQTQNARPVKASQKVERWRCSDCYWIEMSREEGNAHHAITGHSVERVEE